MLYSIRNLWNLHLCFVCLIPSLDLRCSLLRKLSMYALQMFYGAVWLGNCSRSHERPNVCLNCYCGIYFDVVGDEDGNDGDDDNCCVGVV